MAGTMTMEHGSRVHGFWMDREESRKHQRGGPEGSRRETEPVLQRQSQGSQGHGYVTPSICL